MCFSLDINLNFDRQIALVSSKKIILLISLYEMLANIFLKSQIVNILDCGVGEDSWESRGLQGDPTSQS